MFITVQNNHCLLYLKFIFSASHEIMPNALIMAVQAPKKVLISSYNSFSKGNNSL